MGLEQQLPGMYLSQKDYGIHAEGINLHEGFERVEAPTGQIVNLRYLTWHREENYSPSNEDIKYQLPGPVVMLSGFCAEATDLIAGFESYGHHTDTVISLDQPEALTSFIEHHNQPLNDTSFANSGYVILRVIEQLVQRGELRGPVTFAGYSTGVPVGLEAKVHDTQEVAMGLHEPYIAHIIGSCMAGMAEKGDFDNMVEAVVASVPGYMHEYVKDHRKWRIVPESDTIRTRETLTVNDLIENIPVILSRSHVNSTTRAIHFLQKLSLYAADKLNAEDLKQWINRITQHEAYLLGVAEEPTSPSRDRAQELIPHDVTQRARELLYDTPTVLYFYEDDRVVPLAQFLTAQDIRYIKPTHLKFDKPVHKGTDETVRQRIQKRLREKFPNATNLRVYIRPGNHVWPRAYEPTELAADAAYRIAQMTQEIT